MCHEYSWNHLCKNKNAYLVLGTFPFAGKEFCFITYLVKLYRYFQANRAFFRLEYARIILAATLYKQRLFRLYFNCFKYSKFFEL